MSDEQADKKPADQAATGDGAAGQSATSGTLTLSSADMIKRRSRWQSSLAALRYVHSISGRQEVKIRDSDKATGWALLIVCCFAFLTLTMPQLKPWRVGCLGAADALVGVALLMYMANRFGIVTTLNPRQALLIWQLLLGSSLLGIFWCLNLGFFMAVQVGMHPHPIVVPGAAGM